MPGIATISVELELGWGKHDKNQYDHLSADAQREFDALNFFLSVCDGYELPVSFDVVGHLFQEDCSEPHPGPYPDGWWTADPHTDHRTDPLFYAPEFIREIRAADVAHEICTHTYSHILCEEISDEILDRELQTVERLYRERDISEPTSIVTPRHQNPSYEVLRNHGIETIRTPLAEYTPPKWKEGAGPPGTLLWLLTRHHPEAALTRSRGLVETYCTPYPSLTTPLFPTGQLPVHPVIRLIPRSVRRRIHARYLRRAVDQVAATDGHLHLWTHTYNLAHPDQRYGIRRGIEYLMKRRNEGSIVIRRMCDLPQALTDD
jgi:peptidoglycan/xylan/chitin deacetylase (PgdA/CDA1 family)